MKKGIGLLVLILLVCLCFAMATEAGAETVAQSLLGAKNVTVKVNEEIAFRKSDYAIFPAESKIAGICDYKNAEFSMYGYNYIFRGKSEYRTETVGNDTIVYVKPLEPGYYSMYAVASYYDEANDVGYEVTSEFFLLTVLDEGGNTPDRPDPSIYMFEIPSVVKGETIQINWSVKDTIPPVSYQMNVLKDGAILDSWEYDESLGNDRYTFQETGTYTVSITCSGPNSKAVTAEKTYIVTEPGPLQVGNLILESDQANLYRLNWALEYTGGYGTKSADVRLINLDTGEICFSDNTGNLTVFANGVSADGSYQVVIDLTDESGAVEHRESNIVTIGGNTAAVSGLCPDADGTWRYYENGVLQAGYSGLYCDANYGWWLIRNGVIDFNYSGLYNDPNVGWWLIRGGTIAFDYTGLWNDPNVGWWLIQGGTIAFDYTGLWCDPNCGWWLIGGGTICWDYSGLWNDPNYGWWLIGGGTIAWDYTGLWCDPNCGWWLIGGGTICWDYNGLWNDPNYGWWLIGGGTINWGYTGGYDAFGATWNIVNGQLIF